MENIIRLHGHKCNLCVFRDDDEALALYMKWINDESYSRFLDRNTEVTSWEEEREFLKNHRGYIFNIVVTDKDTGEEKLIGNCDIRVDNRNAILGIMIGEKDYHNMGIGTEAIAIMVKYCFEELNMHNVKLNADTQNFGAIACYQKCGFIQCGIEKETTWSKGIWYNTISMQILEQNYFSKIRNSDVYKEL